MTVLVNILASILIIGIPLSIIAGITSDCIDKDWVGYILGFILIPTLLSGAFLTLYEVIKLIAYLLKSIWS